ncbi:hypothetical protein ACFQV8_32640 [Pseudonocardia benzenivorans]
MRTGVAQQVRALARVRHRPEAELPVGELHLDPADARRPVGAQGRDGEVLAGDQDRPDARGELRLCLFDVVPRGHDDIVGYITDSSRQAEWRGTLGVTSVS